MYTTAPGAVCLLLTVIASCCHCISISRTSSEEYRPRLVSCTHHEVLRPTRPCCEPTCTDDCSSAQCRREYDEREPTCVCEKDFVRFRGICIPKHKCPNEDQDHFVSPLVAEYRNPSKRRHNQGDKRNKSAHRISSVQRRNSEKVGGNVRQERKTSTKSKELDDSMMEYVDCEVVSGEPEFSEEMFTPVVTYSIGHRDKLKGKTMALPAVEVLDNHEPSPYSSHRQMGSPIPAYHGYPPMDPSRQQHYLEKQPTVGYDSIPKRPSQNAPKIYPPRHGYSNPSYRNPYQYPQVPCRSPQREYFSTPEHPPVRSSYPNIPYDGIRYESPYRNYGSKQPPYVPFPTPEQDFIYDHDPVELHLSDESDSDCDSQQEDVTVAIKESPFETPLPTKAPAPTTPVTTIGTSPSPTTVPCVSHTSTPVPTTPPCTTPKPSSPPTKPSPCPSSSPSTPSPTSPSPSPVSCTIPSTPPCTTPSKKPTCSPSQSTPTKPHPSKNPCSENSVDHFFEQPVSLEAAVEEYPCEKNLKKRSPNVGNKNGNKKKVNNNNNNNNGNKNNGKN